jgi:beta-lactamase class A
MVNSTLGRKMKGRPAQGDELENWATPNDYAGVLTAILNKTAASAGSCEHMIAMLETQQCTRRISRYLPDADGVRWGSKTGSIAGVTNDVGFIAKDDDVLLLSIFCENLPDQHVGEQLIGDLARAAMQATGIVDPLSSS